MKKTLIKNATIINEYQTQSADLLIVGSRIEKIAGQITAEANMQIIDAAGKQLLPGMIDDQVHFRDPGQPEKADFGTESAAAVAGGITSVMDMPNTNPQTTSEPAIKDKIQSMQGKSHCNYGFYLGVTNDNIEQIKSIDTSLICGMKAFMGSSTGNMLVDDEKTLEQVFQHCPILLATHCEDTPTISQNEIAATAQFGEQIPIEQHPKIRSAEACLKSTQLATSLAKKHGTKLHILHISTAQEIQLLRQITQQHDHISGEACVHFLWFTDQDYPQRGTQIKCNPAIKSAADQAEIIAGINDRTIAVIATDHAPHLISEKQQPYAKAPSGLPLVQTALPSLITLVKRGQLELHQTVDQISHQVAELFSLKDRGYIREGYYADLVLLDMNAEQTVSNQQMLYKCAWTPYHGETFSATVEKTWVNGQLKWSNQQLQNPAQGKPLVYIR